LNADDDENDNEDGDEESDIGENENKADVWDPTSLKEVVDDVDNLHSNNIVDNELLTKVHKSPGPLKVGAEKESLFVTMKSGDKEVKIRKRTAVWLFNDCERVSADRLFRVREKQPTETTQFLVNT
jgi:hypothetical protein